MTTSQIHAVLPCQLQTVWEAVTAVERYALWRSGLRGVAVLDEKRFVEYTNTGFATTFTTTVWEPYSRWEFDMENRNMTGHWTGVFTPHGQGETAVTFTEQVQVKKVYFRPLITPYLKRQQAQFVLDLRKALSPP